MFSAKENNPFLKSDDETSFDTNEIDMQIFKKGECIQTEKGKPDQIKNKFKLLEGLTEEEIKKKQPNDDYPKYFSQINTKQFKYIGVLSSQLKRIQYGYSFMENEDEFLGEYKNELRDGFGIYKFNPSDEEKDIYIGEYKNNTKTGNGIYLKVFKSIDTDSPILKTLIDFNCGIGTFENDIFKEGKIFSVKDGNETLYQGKINELGLPSDNEAYVLGGGDKIFVGKINDGEMVEGRNIFVGENWEKQKAYYFKKTNNEESPYEFDLTKNEEQDEENIKMMKESSVRTYKEQIQNIFDDINIAFDKFQNFDIAIKVNFVNDIKKNIFDKIDKINKN